MTLLIVLGAALYVPGLNWGLPALVSWSQDSIAGTRTLGAMETWPHHWMGRYPPWHYMVLSAAYRPVLSHWRSTGEITRDPVTGKEHWSPPHAPKIGMLLWVAGSISTAMAVGAGLALFFAARLAAAGDELAGLLAAIAFLCGAGFTYFAHLGNVDVPSVFWFSISFWFYTRLWSTNNMPSSVFTPNAGIAPRRPTLDAGLLGLFAALTVCTKDGWIGLYSGMAAALLLDHWRNARKSAESPVAALRIALLQPKWLAGLLAFATVFLIINAIPWNRAAFTDRLGGWLNPTAKDWVSREARHDSLGLAAETIRQAACAVGWPMLVALLASSLWLLMRRTRLAMLLFLPVASYYYIVIERINFVYERFLFAPLMLLGVAGGLAGAAMLRSRRLSTGPKVCLLLMILVPTLGYSVAVDLEMVHDSRYAAEDWFRNNAPPDASIGALTDDLRRFSPQFLPRVHELGFAAFPVHCRVEEFSRPQPTFLVLSGFDLMDFSESGQNCARELLAGSLGYEPVAVFRPKFLGSGASWLGLAGWGAPPPGKISPELTILRVRSGINSQP